MNIIEYLCNIARVKNGCEIELKNLLKQLSQRDDNMGMISLEIKRAEVEKYNSLLEQPYKNLSIAEGELKECYFNFKRSSNM